MIVGAIVLARLDSRRLPQKAFRIVRGKRLVEYVTDVARRIPGVDRVILATSDRDVDTPLADYARAAGIDCFRGAADNVAGRVFAAMQAFALDGAVRVNGDSPMHDAALMGRGVAEFRTGRWDMVTNVPGRTFPFGMSLEVLGRTAMAEVCRRADKPDHFEHVSMYLYEHAADFRICTFTADDPTWKGTQLAVDTERDLARFTWIAERTELASAAPGEVIALAHRFDATNPAVAPEKAEGR